MNLVSTPANPVPDDVVVAALKTPDGVNLRFARWAPPPGRKGTVCIFPGRTEFIEKYFETVRDLRARGFAVTVLDWRGQGLSDRPLRNRRKGHVRNFSQYDLDLATFMSEVVLPDCPPPLFAIGHSMGASILIRAAHHGQRWFDRIVLTAPMIALTGARAAFMSRVTVRSLRMIGLGSAFIPSGDDAMAGTEPFISNKVTSDPVRYARNAAILEAEPALGVGSPTNAWASAAFSAMRAFSDPVYAASIRQPILMVAAGRDEIISTAAIEDFATVLRAGSHLIVAGAKHELLMELDRYRAQFWAAFDAFVPGTPLFG
jgi:lysophospholipase